MSSLRIVEITLAGFGVYEQPTRFRFPDESAVFYGANETGKTTLLYGLAATWFGLPSTNDMSRLGTARFRSLSKPPAFWGEVVWERERQTFRLRRDFETHHIRLTQGTENAGLRVLYEGEHNPQGRSSAGSAFVPFLEEHLGLADLELFLETFCLTAPFPDVDRISADLQHLVTGGRAERADAVLGTLFERIRQLTKKTGELDLTRPGGTRPANQREDGRIEVLQEEVARMEGDLEHARQRLEHAQDHDEEIARLESELERISEQGLLRERRLRALRNWAEENRERVRRSEQLEAARRVLKTYDEIGAEQATLARENESGLDPAAVEPLLHAVEQAAIRADRSREETARLGAERARLDAEIERARQEMAPLEVYAGRTDWAETLRRLREEARRRSALEASTAELEAALEKLPPFPAIGPGLEAIRAAAGSVVSYVSRLGAIEERLAAIDGQLESREYLLENDRLRSLRQKIEIEAELRDCSTLLRERTSALSQFEEVRARRDGSTDRRVSHADGRSPWGGALLGLLPIAIGIASAILTRSIWITAAGAALGLGVALLLHRALRSAPGERSGARPSAPPPIPEPRLKQSLEFAETDVSLLTERRRLLEERIEKCRRTLGPYAAVSATELAALEARWQTLEEERRALDAERADRLSKVGLDKASWRDVACSDQGLGELAPAVGILLPWAAEAATLPSETTLPGLAAWLGQLTDRDWDAWSARERSHQKIREERAALEEQLRSIRASLDDRTQIESLYERLHPFSVEDDPDVLEQGAHRALELGERIAVLEQQRAELDAKAANDPSSALDAAWKALRSAWAALPAEAPEPADRTAWLAQTRRRVRAQQDRDTRMAGLTDSAARLLQSEGAVSRADFERRVTEHDSALGHILRNLDRLEQDQLLASGLPSDAQARSTRLAELGAEEERAEAADRARANDIRKSLLELERKRASMEGQDLPNIASLEIELAETRVELEERERDAKALVRAYRWLEEATQSYQVSHRDGLQKRITAYFGQLTGRPGRRIELDDKFQITVRDEAGRKLEPEQLSQGTRDPLVLAIRLGAADLLSGLPLPLLLDDPFVHCDADRLAHVHTALDRLATQRPWLLLTHRRELADWADPVFVEVPGAQDEKAAVSAKRKAG